MQRTLSNLLTGAAIALTWPACAFAEDVSAAETSDDESKEIVVYGRGEKQIDTATQSSQGTIQGADLRVRPLSRVGEIVEAVPGMIAIAAPRG